MTSGSTVLDVAAGAGGQTLSAAWRVGPSGRVVATDISPTILTYVAKNAADAGLSQVETIEADGEALDGLPTGSFDAVICRLGLIYFPDQARALAGFRRLLRPGGRFAAIVYSTPDRNEFFSVPVSIIRSRAQLPAPQPGQPGPFSLGGPGVIETVLGDAGFSDVDVQAVPAAAAAPVGGRMRTVRAGVVRRPAPDAVRSARGAATPDLGGDRGVTAAVRIRLGILGTVRTAGGFRLEVNLAQAHLRDRTSSQVEELAYAFGQRSGSTSEEGLQVGAGLVELVVAHVGVEADGPTGDRLG